MLLRSPSSLPISASVVELNPLREKHFAAAVRIAATRGFSQSTARGDVPLALVSADSLDAWGTLSAVFMVLLRSRPTGADRVGFQVAWPHGKHVGPRCGAFCPLTDSESSQRVNVRSENCRKTRVFGRILQIRFFLGAWPTVRQARPCAGTSGAGGRETPRLERSGDRR